MTYVKKNALNMELNTEAAMNMSLDDYIAIKKKLKGGATTQLKSSVYGSNYGRRKNNIDNGEDDDDVIMLDDTSDQFVVPSTSNISADADVWKESGSAIKCLDYIDLTEDLRGKIKSKEASGIQYCPNTSSRLIYGMPMPSRFEESQIEQNYNSLRCNNRNNSRRSRRRQRNRRRIIKKNKNIRMKIDNRWNSNNGSVSRPKLFSNLTQRAAAVADLWNNTNNINSKVASQLLEFLQNSAESCTHKPCYNMKIQKDIHDIQKKPLQYYIPGGTLVTEDGVGIDNCKITPNCSGVSLNYRFA
uniref:Uncharacterized protein n=1 Tax=Glossina pallidipes TaxID=7398 RepID=A0A1B0A7J3_GLOPL